MPMKLLQIASVGILIALFCSCNNEEDIMLNKCMSVMKASNSEIAKDNKKVLKSINQIVVDNGSKRIDMEVLKEAKAIRSQFNSWINNSDSILENPAYYERKIEAFVKLYRTDATGDIPSIRCYPTKRFKNLSVINIQSLLNLNLLKCLNNQAEQVGSYGCIYFDYVYGAYTSPSKTIEEGKPYSVDMFLTASMRRSMVDSISMLTEDKQNIEVFGKRDVYTFKFLPQYQIPVGESAINKTLALVLSTEDTVYRKTVTYTLRRKCE